MSEHEKRIEDLEGEVQRLRALATQTTDFAFGIRFDGPEGRSMPWFMGDPEPLTGYTAQEIQAGMSYVDLIVEEDQDVIEDLVSLVLTGQKCSVEVRLRTRDDEVRWIRNSAGPWRNPRTGEVVGIISGVRDVTEHRASDNALAQSEASFRLLIEHAPDGVVITDRDGLIQYLNPAAEQIYGYSQHELVGLPSYRLNAASKDGLSISGATSKDG